MEGLSRLFSGMRISATGMSAERVRIDTVARNIANSTVTRTADGGPYKRQVVEFEPILVRAQDGQQINAGVRVRSVSNDEKSPFERIQDFSHPDADARGWVTYPNVNATREMADLITAVRAYEANIDVQESFVRMADRALRLVQ